MVKTKTSEELLADFLKQGIISDLRPDLDFSDIFFNQGKGNDEIFKEAAIKLAVIVGGTDTGFQSVAGFGSPRSFGQDFCAHMKRLLGRENDIPYLPQSEYFNPLPKKEKIPKGNLLILSGIADKVSRFVGFLNNLKQFRIKTGTIAVIINDLRKENQDFLYESFGVRINYLWNRLDIKEAALRNKSSV